jgi:two-component system response regulator AtoC
VIHSADSQDFNYSEHAPAKPVVVLVDDDPRYLAALRQALESDYELRTATTKVAALSILSPPPDAVILDVCLSGDHPDDESGIELLVELHKVLPHVPVLMATGHSDADTALRCIRAGAEDFLQKLRARPLEIKARLELALKRAEQFGEAQRLLHDAEPHVLVGPSAHMEHVRARIKAVAENAEVTVLIRGETGTGKEVVARTIHRSGPRRSARYVPMVLSAFPEDLVEAALFGSERGAFTGATERRLGYIEEGHKGVLFLDEIGEASLSMQVKLLRFLEEREIQRVGSSSPIRVDVQILAATNADLEERVRDKKFRDDLFQRLQVFEIHLLPLREHPEDIRPLLEHFLRYFARNNLHVPELAPDAEDILTHFDWPGNVRQLRNVVESALIQCRIAKREIIEAGDLPSYVRPGSVKQLGDVSFSVQEHLARGELVFMQSALAMSKGNVGEASKLLGYHDRFVFRRRRASIRRAFPFLLDDFPEIDNNKQSSGS